MCACDQNLDLPCQGNLRLNRCPTTLIDTRKAATVTCTVTRSAVDGGVVSKVLGSVVSTEAGELLKGELALIQHLHVIPVNHLLKSSEIVLLSKGTWDTSLEEMPAYTHKSYITGGQVVDPFPLIPGAQWRRSFRGKHAAAVDKPIVIILFSIQMSTTTPDSPLFVTCDFETGVFGKRVSSSSMGGLEKAWLSQNQVLNDAQISKAYINGARFMGLDIPTFTNFLAGLVPSFQGARLREKERGRSKQDIGSRQKKRVQACLVEDFETTLGKAFPDDLAEAFELL